MKDRQIDRYIQKGGDKQSQDRLYKWLRKSPKNTRYYSLKKAQYVVEALKKVSVSKTDMRHVVPRYKKLKQTLVGVLAAACVILLWVSVPKEPVSYVEFQAGIGHRHHLILPDSSSVILNAGSRLRYPKDFGVETRNVQLVGEAVFDVYHDPNRPFTVSTNELKVQVLGTRFNLRAYPKDKTVETTLIHGKVEVYPKKALPVVLKPAQKAVFDIRAKKITVEETVTDQEEAWRHGQMVFNRTPLEQVVGDFERYYNKKIKIQSQNLFAYEYTGSFDNLSFEDAMRLLSISSPVKWREHRGVIWLEWAP